MKITPVDLLVAREEPPIEVRPNEPVLTRGDLLIASPYLRDPNFHRSVIVLCDHSEEGSLGLILNRPLSISLGQLFDAVAKKVPDNQPICQGGPVEPNRLLALRRGLHPEESSEQLVPDLHMLVDLEQSISLIESGAVDPSDYRFYLGYSGWESDQLNSELTDGAWIVSKATKALTFEVRASEVWAQSMRTLGGRYEIFAEMPTDPELN